MCAVSFMLSRKGVHLPGIGHMFLFVKARLGVIGCFCRGQDDERELYSKEYQCQTLYIGAVFQLLLRKIK